MKRIRLQVQIMPWQESGPASSGPRTRQEAVFKWCEPCTEDLTIQTLADRITARWAKKYVGYGALDIKRLETIYGDLLDMDDIVGAFFDDRTDCLEKLSSHEVLPTSVVQVYRFPPRQDETQDVLRFGSLMPESTARPRKRPLEVFTQDPPINQRPTASIEERDGVHMNGAFAVPNKRQRTNDPRTRESYSSRQLLRSQQEPAVELHSSSQGQGTQGSIHQVNDSQTSLAKGHSNPYGTPTSLSLVSPLEPQLHNHIEITTIPDSPTRRGAATATGAYGWSFDHERGSTKSESPEIRLSVHDVPYDELDRTTESINRAPAEPKLDNEVPTSAIITQPSSVEEMVDEIIDVTDREVQQHLESANGVAQNAPGRTYTPIKEVNGSKRHSERVFDEIESDSESFREKQQMHCNKRPNFDLSFSRHPSSPRPPMSLRKDVSDGRFLIPDIPQPRERRSSFRDDEKGSRGEGSKTTGIHLNGGNERAVSPPETINQEEDTSADNRRPVFEEQNADSGHNADTQKHDSSLSQATTGYPQISDTPAKNWSDLDVEHPMKKALSQGRKPDLSILSNSTAPDYSRRSQGHDGVGPSGNQQGSEIVEEQQQDRDQDRTTAERLPALKASGKPKHLAEQEEVQLARKQKTIQSISSTTPNVKSVETGAEQLAEAARNSPKLVEDNAQKLPPAKIRGNKSSGSHGLVSKEQTLSKQAEKMIMEADGAKQLHVEKLEKQKTRSSALGSKGTAAKPSEPPKYKPRTEEQKAQRIEREAKKRAEKRKVDDSKKSPNWAQSLFQTSSGGTHRSSEPIEIDSEADTIRLKRPRSRSSGRAVENPKMTLTDTAIRSSSPSGSSVLGQNRKSLTPAVPRPSAYKSRSKSNSIMSSSPFASRSATHIEAPLRSALKQNQAPGTLRRSVSFFNDQTEKLAEPAPRSLVELNNELALTASIGKAKSTAAKCEASTAQPETLQPRDCVVKKPRARSVSAQAKESPSVKRDLEQQKLSVTRDKKMKGRATDAPKTEPKQAIVISSSDGNSTSSSSDEDIESGNAKAGPSSRKRPLRAARLYQDPSIKTNLQGTPIDPAIENMSATNCSKEPPLLFPRSISASTATSQVKSISRSPAHAVSEAASTNSGSASRSDSISDSGSGSNSDSQSASASESESLQEVESPTVKVGDSQKGQRKLSEIHGPDKALRVQVKPHGDAELSSDRSDSSRASSSDDVAHGDEAGRQLQLESRQSVPTQHEKTGRPSSNGKAERNNLPNPGLDRNARLPNGPRPTDFKFPKISTVRASAEASQIKEEASAIPVSQKRMDLTEESPESSSSSSGESSSDVGNETEQTVNQASPKSKSGGFAGLNGVMKLARKMRGQ